MRILAISLSNIGDAVMTTPVLERLHALYPDAVVDIIGDRRSSILFTHCPYRGEIFHKRKEEGWHGLLKLIRQLRRTHYDLIADLRTDGLAYLLRGRRRLVKWGRKAYGPHAVEDLMSIIDRINPERTIPAPKVWLSAAEHTAADTLLEGFAAYRLLALGPGANWEPKIWAAEAFAETANLLGTEVDGVVLLGGPGDVERARRVVQRLELPHRDLTSRCDLLTAAAVLERCALFIGNDSGLGHLASGVGTPTLTVFGSGQPARYHPWGTNARWLVGAQRDLANVAAADVTALARAQLAHAA
ncbi:MAG: glycosyltransferase family 9 protein [Rhodocyclaceae bacterium]